MEARRQAVLQRLAVNRTEGVRRLVGLLGLVTALLVLIALHLGGLL